MPQHFKLKANIGGSEVVSESLTMSGNNFSFKVLPTENNTSQQDIHASVVLTHNNKSYSIALNHRSSNEDYQDPEPSISKWSYVDDLYVSYDAADPDNPVRVDETDAKSFQYGYLYVEAGMYNNNGNLTQEPIDIGYVFTTESMAKNSLINYCKDKTLRLDEPYEKLCRFKMFYKLPTIDPITGDPVIPTDDGTPESNRLRLPCKVEFQAPYWLTNTHVTFIKYRIKTTSINSEVVETDYDDWDTFRSAWETVRLNTTDYSDVKFYGYLCSDILHNEQGQRGPDTIVIQEVPQEINGVWKVSGAKPLHIYIGQLEIRTPLNRRNPLNS